MQTEEPVITLDHVKAEFLAGTIDDSIALSWLFNPLKPEGGQIQKACFCFSLKKAISILYSWKSAVRSAS
ncbi:hypothetical protein GZ77_20615 [Endozoicomonas montiporae]|uniref:Uncharacterized protein n=2 Tax=Endozoicomonas montiporae TaxID=1027273 RepID=A0A081N325_9GAMM|nr:hypothetical protein [Endozoicomonas montiporae]AMO58140.1 hypothetical protein EZMO1_4217 [Endozoicomonas montiporae CL-33]KEQ12848.1 hypothetical protein GZ77_20615 [Endozoicomonas montiporae]